MKKRNVLGVSYSFSLYPEGNINDKLTHFMKPGQRSEIYSIHSNKSVTKNVASSGYSGIDIGRLRFKRKIDTTQNERNPDPNII